MQDVRGVHYTHIHIKQPEVILHVVGDIHLGAPTSRVDALYKLITSAQENEYFVFAGDILDNALRDTVVDIYSQTQNPHEAVKGFIDLLDATHGRTLGVVIGNHDMWTWKRVGIDIFELICTERRIPYSRGILVLDIGVGEIAYGSARRQSYMICIGHGTTSARTIGGKINANARIEDVVEGCDVYVTGHTHHMDAHKRAVFTPDRRNKQLYRREYWMVTIPAWIGYEEYASRKFYAPNSFGTVRILLSGTYKKSIRVMLE